MEFFILTLVNIGFLILVFLYFKSRFQQSLNAPALLKDVKEEVDVMVRELNISAERNISVLEERQAQLEELLAQADAKVLLLTKELEKREKTQETYSKLKRPVVVAAEGAEIPLEKPLPELSQEKRAVSDEGELFSGEPIGKETVPPPPKPPVSKPKTLKEKVLGLRDQDHGAEEISRLTGATLAEVELILSLNPRAFRP